MALTSLKQISCLWIYFTTSVIITTTSKGDKVIPIEDTIKRINELAHKAKTEGLTEDEMKEREQLRNIYRQSVIGNLKAQLDNTSIREADGTVRPLKRQ
ncbi:MAG: DUF896 domain-containing protein [Clostridiales bacterium]|nr:DUF896 domain-containing protein [Clostridiales bacterium]